MGLLKIGKLFSKEEIGPAVKPERNDLCWCGSGKKYKKCHLPEDDRKTAKNSCSLNCGHS
jgi:hypothetical protein